MKIDLFEIKEKYKIILMIALLALASFLTYYFHAVLKISIVFTHFFYIPIILSALWWKRKGFVVALFLVVLIISSDLFIKKIFPTYDEIIRSIMFMIISVFVIMLSEIIERNQEISRENDEKFRLVVQSANDAIILTDSNDNIVGSNRVSMTMFGYHADELIGQPFSNLLPDRYKDTYRYALEWMLLEKDLKITQKSIELHGLRKDRTEFALELSVASWKTGKGVYYSSIIRDISDRKRLEEEIIKVNLDLKMADQVKNKFLSVVSHELKTPIAPMKGQTQLMLAGYFGELTEKQRISLEMILRNTSRLERLIGDILDISKLEAGVMKFTMETASINELTRNAVEMMKQKANDKKIRISLIEKDSLQLIMDADRISQVLINLLNNAIKFTNQGGSILVEVSSSQKNVNVKVIDNGIGIEKKDQDRLFHPFVQVDSANTRKFEGTGLGLAICKGIIDSHRGKIWIESEPGKGSVFQFNLPLDHHQNENKTEVNIF